MKRNISRLLDGYPADVDLSGTAPTPLSPSRIEELTMKKITEQNTETRGKVRRLPLRALTVAAVAAALCGSAVAAGHVMGAGDWFSAYFTPKDGTLTGAQVEMMNEIGQTFEGPDGTTPAAVTSNGATITPLAAIADENVYYLRLRVEAPAGTVLPDLDGDVDGYYQLSGDTADDRIRLEFDEGAYESYGYFTMFFWQPDANPTDNGKEVVVRITKQGGTDLDFLDGVSKRLVIRGLWVQSPYKVYTPVFTGDFTFDIGLSYESKTLSLDCAGLTRESSILGGYTNTLNSMTLSPLSLAFDFSTTMLENDYCSPGLGPVEIVMKDGSVFYSDFEIWAEDEALHGTPPEDREIRWEDYPYPDYQSFITFDEPLDLDQVDYIRYGENIIPLQ